MISRHLKSMGISISKVYEKKRKILESEVSSEAATKGIDIDALLQIVEQ